MVGITEIEHLFECYPEFFERFTGVFDIDYGWFPLIRDLCVSLHTYTESLPEENKVYFIEINKRFGVLNITYDGGDMFVAKLINLAERLSFKTCEFCGRIGKLHSLDGTEFSDLYTLCNEDALLGYEPINYMDMKVKTRA